MPLLKPGQPIRTTGNNLVGLWRPSFVKVDHRLFVYGGGGNVTNDLHVLNLCDMRWDTIQTAKGTAPCKRYGHTATLWNNCIIVFGGCNEHSEYCDDVHIFDIDKLTWHQPPVTGRVPARYLHSAIVYDDKLYVYGGFAKKTECTYVLDELTVLDLKTFVWQKFQGVPPRYNHSATLIGHKMYIYGGKDEQGNTVSDLFVVNVSAPPYTPHLVLSGFQSSISSQMVLLKSQHFCEAVCGKLLVFGRYLAASASASSDTASAVTTTVAHHHHHHHHHHQPESVYGLWMLDLDTLRWERQDCTLNFNAGGWNYFTVVTENIPPESPDKVTTNNLFFLGNTDPFRPQGYDHFRDALIMNTESLGLYDIPPPHFSHEFGQLLDNPELSDFAIVPATGQALHVHQVILITRWPHFRNIYKSGMMEAQERRMEMPESYETVRVFLQYLYSDCLDKHASWAVVCDVLVMANMYLLNRLKKICCERLYKHHLSIESCGTVLEKAILAEETGLKTLTLDFMFKHYGLVLKADIIASLPLKIRHEFYNAVPDDAVLDVISHRTMTSASSLLASPTKPYDAAFVGFGQKSNL